VTRRAENRPYTWLAKYYDQLFTFHIGWFESARKRILDDILPQVESAWDLAAGTGTTALVLASKGIRMYAVDLSPVMCWIARKKAQDTGLPLRVIRADMRDFRLPGTVDLVLCEFDALNHVGKKQDLARVGRAVARALKPGGYFYFDVNNRRAFQRIRQGTWLHEKPGLALVMHGGYDAEHDRGWTNLEWFLREGRCWRRHRERVEQVCWSASEIRDTLRASGFSSIRAWDATQFFRGHAKIDPGCRAFYVARKAKR
jgi:SAM-dependent methyltransferase